MAKEQTKWQKHLMATWKEMKAGGKKVPLGDAMKEAAKTFKK